MNPGTTTRKIRVPSRCLVANMMLGGCYVDFSAAGSGGTEAQDWIEMLLRMYLPCWAESEGFKTELVEVSDGDVAGLKSATIKVSGEYAFGWFGAETGDSSLSA